MQILTIIYIHAARSAVFLQISTTRNFNTSCKYRRCDNLRICLSGLGRTGSQIAKYLSETGCHTLVSAICGAGSAKHGHDVGEIIGTGRLGIPVYSCKFIEPCFMKTMPEVVMDFSTPEAALKNAEIFSKLKVPIVMGTTGFTHSQEERLFSLVRLHKGGMIYAPNITLGVNTLMLLSEIAAEMLDGYDIQIIEMHHNRKHDIPSGTAKKMAAALSEKRRVSDGAETEIPVASVRAGGIVGTHKVMLVGKYDMIEISHNSFSRNAFAEGAVFAAEFIKDKTGVYEMKDAMGAKRHCASKTGKMESPVPMFVK